MAGQRTIKRTHVPGPVVGSTSVIRIDVGHDENSRDKALGETAIKDRALSSASRLYPQLDH